MFLAEIINATKVFRMTVGEKINIQDECAELIRVQSFLNLKIFLIPATRCVNRN